MVEDRRQQLPNKRFTLLCRKLRGPSEVCLLFFLLHFVVTSFQRVQVLRVLSDTLVQVSLEQEAAVRASPTSSEDAAEWRPKRIKMEEEQEVCN